MSILHPDQYDLLIEEYDLPFYVKGDLYRIGTIADGSCMIHSILLGLSDEYRKNNREYRIMMASLARKDLSEKVTPEIWERLGKGNVAFHGFLENFRNQFNTNADGLFSQLMNKKIETISDFIHNFKQFITDSTTVDSIAKNTYKESYEEFVKSIANTSVWIDSSMIELLQLYFNVNLIIVYDRTKLPYPIGKDHLLESNKYLIIYWVGDSHYELLGLKNDEKMQVVFEKTDPIIHYFLSKI